MIFDLQSLRVKLILKSMTLLEAMLYGGVQGLTEYLPVSSSAHLLLLPQFLKTQDPGLAFDVFLHVGTLMSTLIYFRNDWFAMFKPKSEVSLKHVIFATVPALLVGAAIHQWAETAFRSKYVTVVALLVGGLMLVLSDRYAKKNHQLRKLSNGQAIFVGFFQCLALVPGISRSGSTLTAGRLLGLPKTAAARFSFLISAPITAAALVFESRKLPELMASAHIGADVLLVGAVSAFVFGWLAISGLLKLVQTAGFEMFLGYRVLLMIAILSYI